MKLRIADVRMKEIGKMDPRSLIGPAAARSFGATTAADRQRYLTDASFHAMVSQLAQAIERGEATADDIRTALNLADEIAAERLSRGPL